MTDVYVSGLGSFLPENKFSNREIYPRIRNFEIDRAKLSLSKKGIDVTALAEDEIFDHWVRQVTGIQNRTFYSPPAGKERSAVELMASFAAEKAVRESGLEFKDIEHIVFSSYTCDTVIPNAVCTLCDILGITSASGIMLNGACSGFLDAFIDGYIKIAGGFFSNVLVVASEYISNKIDFRDPATAILFSDGAGACVLRSGKKGIHGFHSAITFNNEHITMDRGGPIYMDGGPLVQRKAVQAMSTAAENALRKFAIPESEIRYIIPHQANRRILEALELKLKPHNRCTVVKCIEQTGNLSSATIPVAMDLLRNNRIAQTMYEPGGKTVLTSVGGGYTYSAVVLDF